MKDRPMKPKSRKLPDIIPILPMRDSIIFPRMVVPLMVQDSEYSRLIDDTLQGDRLIVLALAMHPGGPGEIDPEVHRVGRVKARGEDDAPGHRRGYEVAGVWASRTESLPCRRASSQA